MSETTATMLTALGTLALAAATFASLVFAWRSLRGVREQIAHEHEQLRQGREAIEQGQDGLAQTRSLIVQGNESLNQTRESLDLAREQLGKSQIAVDLSRVEIEEAHRPVVIPVGDRRGPGPGAQEDGQALPSVPEDGVLLVPVANIGSGPAINLRARVELIAAAEDDREQSTNLRGLGMAAGGRAVIEIIDLWKASKDSDFTLQLFYEDVAAKMWETRCGYVSYLGYTVTTVRVIGDAERRALESRSFAY